MRYPRKTGRRNLAHEEGFGLIEAIFAAVILVIGLTALAGLFAQSLTSLQNTRNDLIAKQKGVEALEEAYSARNDASVGFALIQNISKGGIFNDGFQPLYVAGANGIVGTSSDTTVVESETFPGPDGKLGTADDIIVPLNNFQRQILIQPVVNPDTTVSPDLRQITVTIRVSTPGMSPHDYIVSGYISQYQ
jgi:hypothetical protein